MGFMLIGRGKIGVLVMGETFKQQWLQKHHHVLKGLLPDITDASAETLEILMDIDQVSELLGSFQDVQLGKMVPVEQAFGDLS